MCVCVDVCIVFISGMSSWCECVCVCGLRVSVSNGQQWLRVRERYNMVFAYVRRSECYGSVYESESERCSTVGRASERERESMRV